MKKFLVSMLSESDGSISTTRVITLLSLVMGFIIAITGLILSVDLVALSLLVGSFTGPALANKAISKFAEVKGESKDEPK